MPDNREECLEKILSNDYADYYIRYVNIDNYTYDEGDACIIPVDQYYGVIYFNRAQTGAPAYTLSNYSRYPSLYTLLDTSSMISTGVLSAQEQPVLNLRGQGVMIGFIDTGIDYQNPIFRNPDGSTRIWSIWDQTIQSDPSESVYYGTEYTREMINQALASDNPLDIVPSQDTNGHGTFMAGIAAGGANTEADFIGVAPESELVVVKLKEAKPYLKSFFEVHTTDVPVYQGNDIMLGVKYLLQIKEARGIPMVIFIGLGSNQGTHSGYGILDSYLARSGDIPGVCMVLPAGNEANMRHHYTGTVSGLNQFDQVEIRVGENEPGFALELWAEIPETYSIAIRSPTGEQVPQIPYKLGQSTILNFVFEETVIYVDYQLVEGASGNQLILLRFQKPTPGIWTLQVYNTRFINGVYNMWLPITGFISPNTYFIEPNPNITVTAPSTPIGVLCFGGYNHRNGSLYLSSGRGYSTNNTVKPDLVAPAVDVYGPGLRGTYVTRTGTSVAAAHGAGVAASLLSWGTQNTPSQNYNTTEVRSFMIRGAVRSRNLIYPNREWGYGTLNLYNIFEELRS